MYHSNAARAPGRPQALDNKVSARRFSPRRFITLLSLAIIGTPLSSFFTSQVRAQSIADPIFVRDHNQTITWDELNTHCGLTEEDRAYTKQTPCKIASLGAFSTVVSQQSRWATVSVAIQMQNWDDLGQAPRNHFIILEGDSERRKFHPIDVNYDLTDEHIDFSGIQYGILGQFVVVTGHSGVHGYAYNVFRRGDSAWTTFDANSWLREFQAQLPKGWWTPEPILMNFGTGFALLELHRPNATQAIGTGGMAIVQLAIRGNRFVVAKVSATNTRFN